MLLNNLVTYFAPPNQELSSETIARVSGAWMVTVKP